MLPVTHIAIIVKDIERSAQFYMETLGCEFFDEMEKENIKIMLLRSQNQTIELIERKHTEFIPREAGPIDHIAFEVENLEQAMEKVQQAGMQFLSDEPRISGSMKLIFFTGPNNERIELIEYLQ